MIDNWHSTFTGYSVNYPYTILVDEPHFWIQYCDKKNMQIIELNTTEEESKSSCLKNYLEGLVNKLKEIENEMV